MKILKKIIIIYLNINMYLKKQKACYSSKFIFHLKTFLVKIQIWKIEKKEMIGLITYLVQLKRKTKANSKDYYTE
jgi:hypothetical protein